jgi:NADH-quinone oxidoreductase subunit I
MKSVRDFMAGCASLVTGLRVTLKQFFKPPVTEQYPYEQPAIPPRFRGHIELVRDPATGEAMCFACKICEKSCPSDCIIVDGEKFPGAKRKSVTTFKLDFTKCSLCGSCVESCKSGAIRFSREYNLASFSKEDYVMDLFRRLENEARSEPAKPAGAAAEPPGATTTAAEAAK